MSRINRIDKSKEPGQVQYLVTTEDGDLYVVIYVMRIGKVFERVYYLNHHTVTCLRSLEYPSHQMPETSFKFFIEGRGLAH